MRNRGPSDALGPSVHAVKAAVRTFLSCLREIFDESAYARYLARAGQTSSIDSYAAFRQETELAKTRRPRCC